MKKSPNRSVVLLIAYAITIVAGVLIAAFVWPDRFPALIAEIAQALIKFSTSALDHL